MLIACRQQNKILRVYFICMLVPLLLVDSSIIYTMYQSTQGKRKHEMENVASAVQYNFVSQVEKVSSMAKKIYLNKYIERFLEKEFDSTLDYVTDYQSFMRDTLLESITSDTTLLTMYADNEGIVNGGMFSNIESAQGSRWYQQLKQSGNDEALFVYFDEERFPTSEQKRRIVFAKKLNYFLRSNEKVLKMELDYTGMVQSLINMNYDRPIYISQGNTVIMSNRGKNSIGRNFEKLDVKTKTGYKRNIHLYGADFTIYVMDEGGSGWQVLKEYIPVFIILVLANVIFPVLMVSEYNKNKLREQEMKLAKTNAELLALHSQINPHFLFNALESIRMHSVLKQEYETASMVEKLAVMERQNVEWGNDSVEIKEEIEFAKAYLGLQKYRFGDRLSFEFDIDENCERMKIPKLTIVTFVENACVHGIEGKTTPGWIFVRVYKQKEELCIEIEDTGCGMDDGFMKELRQKMQNANIQSLKKKGRVGMINACLRLKLLTNDEVKFELDGEKGMGTMVLVRIPIAYV